MSSFEESLSTLFRLVWWGKIEDLSTYLGRARFERLLSEFESLLSHEWFRELLSRRQVVRVVDLCAGTGIASIALCKRLQERGLKVSLTLVDVRRDALEKGREFVLKELGVEPRIVHYNVLKLHELGLEGDIVTILGNSVAQFSPWQLSRLLAITTKIVASDGLLLFDVFDMKNYIMIHTRFKDFLLENFENNRIVISISDGELCYNPITGTLKRIVIDLISREWCAVELYYWDIAGPAALAWNFYEDVDIIQTREHRAYILCKSPKKADVERYFRSMPRCLSKQNIEHL